MTTILIRSLAVVVLVTVFVGNVRAGFINGDFSTPLSDLNAGWSTESVLGDPPVLENGRAKFEIGTSSVFLHLEQTVFLPTGVSVLAFEYQLSVDPSGVVVTSPSDVFQVSLLDQFTFEPWISVDATEDRFFALDASGIVATAAEVAEPEILDNGFTRVSLDVSSLAGQEVLLEFYAFGEDDGFTTTVLVDNVVLTQSSAVIPEPGSFAIWGLLCLTTIGVSVRRRRNELF